MGGQNSSYDLALHNVIPPINPGNVFQRPSEWPSLGVVSTNTIKGIVKINKEVSSSDGIPLALFVTCAGGTYSVDWGDGTTTTGIATNTKTSKLYDPANTTLTDTTYGYKCAVVTITATANITNFNLQQVPFTYPSAIAMVLNSWLDLAINTPNLTALTISNTNQYQAINLIQSVRIINSSLTSFANLFINCSNLEYCEVNSSATVTNMAMMFQACRSLVNAPALNTSSVTNISAMFSSCESLKYVPLYNFSSVTNAASVFSGCTNLRSLPPFNLSSATSINSIFNACRNLVKSPAITTSASLLDASNSFAICSSLREVILFNTQSVTTFSGMFSSCGSLSVVPLFNTASATNFSSMFSNCFSLVSIPLYNVTAGTNFSSMFSSCYSLEIVPALVTTNIAATSGGMFINCSSLKEINMTKWPDLTNPIPATATQASPGLGTDALNVIFNALPTVTGTKVLNIATCRGKATATTSIATAKGWTVTV